MNGDGLNALDQLTTLVCLVNPQGQCLWANAALEQFMGVSRKHLQRSQVLDWVQDPLSMSEAIKSVAADLVASGRFDAQLRPMGLGAGEPLPVHVIVGATDERDCLLVEMVEILQQLRQDRDERVLGQALANKELIRNLAHEIKNPLGGIRGAAQLLAMDLPSPELQDYTQVIIQEADRLQSLVDRLLAPHRRPTMVDDVNIHEICERVRALILAEFPQGLSVVQDYDASLPEFRGDREQLIQAVLNIAHNATQALASRIAAGDAVIVLRTRVARHIVIGRQRYRLALELHIQDNGPGIPEAIRDHIFQPLVSGRDGGTGLGLTLAQTFVQQHQGVISCDSSPGLTEFNILIPLP